MAIEVKPTPRQLLFVQEYLVDMQGKAAAVRAGYSPRSAKYRAAKLLTRPHVQTLIAQAMAARSKATNITAERVLAEIALVGFADLQDHVETGAKGTKIKPFDQMPDGASRALESLAESHGPSGDRVTIKLHDKMKALEMLAKHLGLCKEQVDVSGGMDSELVIKVVKL